MRTVNPLNAILNSFVRIRVSSRLMRAGLVHTPSTILVRVAFLCKVLPPLTLILVIYCNIVLGFMMLNEILIFLTSYNTLLNPTYVEIGLCATSIVELFDYALGKKMLAVNF